MINDRCCFRLFGIEEADVIAAIKKINPKYSISYEHGAIENDILVASVCEDQAKAKAEPSPPAPLADAPYQADLCEAQYAAVMDRLHEANNEYESQKRTAMEGWYTKQGGALWDKVMVFQRQANEMRATMLPCTKSPEGT